MADIERRIEVPGHEEPDYAGFEITEERRERGVHRGFVGGMWDEMGSSSSASSRTRASDYGTDINSDLVETGYRHELDDLQRARLPLSNLRTTDRFDNDFGVAFDLAITQSVFTHIPLNMMRLCLHRVAKVMKPGGKFYVTFFEAAAGFPLDGVAEGRLLYIERNPYWYYRSDMRWVARRSPWEFRYIGDWKHPNHQRMVEYTRLGDSVPTRPRPGPAAA